VAARLWGAVTLLWALYYAAVFTLGRNEAYQQSIIWFGGALVGMVTLPLLLKQGLGFFPEAVLLAVFSAWTLTGLPEATSAPALLAYFKLSVQMAAIVFVVGLILRRSGGMKWFYWSLVAVAVFNVVLGLEGGPDIAVLVDSSTRERATGLTRNANTLGLMCALGFFGVLALLGQLNSWVIRAALLGAGAVCLYGTLRSASRGAFLVAALVLLLWPALCYKERLRNRWSVIFPVLIAGAIAMVSIPWVLENTYLGARLNTARYMEDSSTETRLSLILTGLTLFAENPLLGVGLGQFPYASGTGRYSHNEWAELLATTGVVGFGLYMAVYWCAWQRLMRVLRRVRDPAVKYQVNVARLVLVVLVLSGLTFRPNFLSIDSMFLVAIVVGAGLWGESQVPRRLPPGLRRAVAVPRPVSHSRGAHPSPV
jgi:O-antigen ligase